MGIGCLWLYLNKVAAVSTIVASGSGLKATSLILAALPTELIRGSGDSITTLDLHLYLSPSFQRDTAAALRGTLSGLWLDPYPAITLEAKANKLPHLLEIKTGIFSKQQKELAIPVCPSLSTLDRVLPVNLVFAPGVTRTPKKRSVRIGELSGWPRGSVFLLS